MNEFVKELNKKEVIHLDRILAWSKDESGHKHFTNPRTLTDYIFKDEGITQQRAEYYLDLLCSYRPIILNKTKGFGDDPFWYQRTSEWNTLRNAGGFKAIVREIRCKEIKKYIYKGGWDLIKIVVSACIGIAIGLWIHK